MSNFTYSRSAGNVVISYSKPAGSISVTLGGQGSPSMFPGLKATVPNSSFQDGSIYVIAAYSSADGTGTALETDYYVANPGSVVQLAGGSSAGSGWRDSPQFKALSAGDQGMFLNFVNTDNGQLKATRDGSCNTIIMSDAFKEPAIQLSILESMRSASGPVINELSRYMPSASFLTPDLSKMSNKDVKNAQCCLVRIIGAMCKVYAHAKTPDVKTIMQNTLDGYCTGMTAIMILVDGTDPIVSAHSNVGDLVYRDRRIGINTVGFGISATGIQKSLDMVCTLAHGYGHYLRFPFHQANPTPDNSSNHFADEIFSYYTEFAVRWDTNGHPSGDDMEKATDALNRAPYKYSSATGDEQKLIKAISDRMRMAGKDSNAQAPDPAGSRPDGASWNYLNN